MMTYAQIEALPYRYIVWTAATGDQPAGPDLAATEALATHLQRLGSSLPVTWKGAEIVTHTEALRRVATAEGDLYDAWTRALLPADEASAWTNPELLYAAHWGVATAPPEWQGSRWPNADALLFDAQQKYPGVGKLLAAFGRQPESVRAAAKERATTAKAPPSQTGSVLVRDVFDHIRLRDFLRDRFSPDEAHRALMELTDGRALVVELPNYMLATRSSYASEAAIKLFEFGVSADELTAILCEKRGRLKAEILSLRIR